MGIFSECNYTKTEMVGAFDKYGFYWCGLQGVLVVLYKPFMLGLWEVYMFVWLESLFIGSYIYHSDVIASVQLCYESSEIIQSACTYYSPFIIHTI